MEVSIKEARGKFSAIVHQVEEGEEVILLRRGKEVARMIPPAGKAKRLPSLREFRSSIRIAGKVVSESVIDGRREERY